MNWLYDILAAAGIVGLVWILAYVEAWWDRRQRADSDHHVAALQAHASREITQRESRDWFTHSPF